MSDKYINIKNLSYLAKSKSSQMIYYILRNLEIVLDDDYNPVIFDDEYDAERWCSEMNDMSQGECVYYQPIGTLKKVVIK